MTLPVFMPMSLTVGRIGISFTFALLLAAASAAFLATASAAFLAFFALTAFASAAFLIFTTAASTIVFLLFLLSTTFADLVADANAVFIATTLLIFRRAVFAVAFR
jgi:hypothetical protein